MKLKYRIGCHNSPSLLEEEVKKFLNAGWQCQGGVSAIWSSETQEFFYIQALIKKEPSSISPDSSGSAQHSP